MNAKIMNNKSREYMIFNVFLRMNSTEVKAGTEIKKKYLSLAVCMSLSLSPPSLPSLSQAYHSNDLSLSVRPAVSNLCDRQCGRSITILRR